MNPLALLATKWHLVVVTVVLAIACLRCLASLELRDVLPKEQVERDKAKLQEIAKNFTEFLLASLVWIFSLRYWAESFDERFSAGFWHGTPEGILFLVSMSFVTVTPLYALVWAWGCTFKPCNRLTRDAYSKYDDHHLYCLTKKLGLAWVFLTVFWIVMTILRIVWKIGCLIALVITGYYRYYRNKFRQVRS